MKRKALLIFIAVLAMMLITAVPAMADTYKYDVTFEGGLHGEVTGDDSATVDYGKTIDLDDYTANVTDEKYYFKGFHRAGQEGIVNGGVEITEDTIFVGAYGIAGNQVAYTVNFVDTDGNELEESRTYYGDIGDNPTVAYIYIEGYLPQVETQTIELSENEADNEITFVYEEYVAPEGETTIIDDTDNNNQGGNAGGNAQPGGNAAPGGNAQPGDNGDNGNGETINGNDTPTTNPDGTDNGNVDNSGDNGNGETIDGNDTPTTTPDGTENGDNAGDEGNGEGENIDDNETPLGTYIGGGVAALLAILAILYFAVFRKKNEEK